VLTERKDDRFGRVVVSKSLTINDLVNIAVSRRTDLNPSTLKTAFELITNVAKEALVNGGSVNFGLGYLSLGVNGVFIGDNAQWDASQHALSIKFSPTSELREEVKSAKVNVRGMAASGTFINMLTDVASGETNSRLTRGGGVNLTGSKLKIDGDDASVGVSLINQTTNDVVAIPRKSILVNDPSKITFIVPADLAEGDYKLSITTQFAGASKLLKEARSFTYDYVLNVTA
jgi:hypothetical protein